MTIGYTQVINKKPNHFIEKIWEGLNENNLIDNYVFDYQVYSTAYFIQFGNDWDGFLQKYKPKCHTIRGLWKNKNTGEISARQIKAGDNLHFVINNRTPKRFQFAPIVKCVSTQTIEITSEIRLIEIDDRVLGFSEVEKLAINDGFDSVEDFFAYFNKDFTGQIIHWTNLKY